MDPFANPYNPGAGTRPPALVGREPELLAMDVALERLKRGTNGRSQLLTGLRGVGKTVLLNEFEELALGRGYFHEHIEVSDDGSLAPLLASALRRVLLAMDAKKRIGDAIKRALGVLKAFSFRIPEGPELSIDVDAVIGPADSGDLATDLSGLFVELGQVARQHDAGIMLTIDELHYVDMPTLTALIVGLHRSSQLRLPVIVAGAGLPTLASLSGASKTYAERMFTFPIIGSLSGDHAIEALQTPAADLGVSWSPSALDRVLEVTQCFPYFLQEFGKAAWDVADGPDVITLDDLERCIPLAEAELDDGFFRVRTGATSDAERRYMSAMAQLGPGPVRTVDVADLLGRDANAVSRVREGLLKGALCYSPRYGEIAFTVPLFDQFMKRWLPYDANDTAFEVSERRPRFR
ncbi:MAG TPA: ATP-binding protein [Acidimicrobiales bacterium]|nr:ATP-binding protein [Acidimicrobiales bacterium]